MVSDQIAIHSVQLPLNHGFFFVDVLIFVFVLVLLGHRNFHSFYRHTNMKALPPTSGPAYAIIILIVQVQLGRLHR